jgi:hypothetical protein
MPAVLVTRLEPSVCCRRALTTARHDVMCKHKEAAATGWLAVTVSVAAVAVACVLL